MLQIKKRLRSCFFTIDDFVHNSVNNVMAWYVIIVGTLLIFLNYLAVSIIRFPAIISEFIGRRLGKKYTIEETFSPTRMERIENRGQKVCNYLKQSCMRNPHKEILTGYYPKIFSRLGMRQKSVADSEGRKLSIWRVIFESATFDIITHKERGTSYETETKDEKKIIRFLRMVEKNIKITLDK